MAYWLSENELVAFETGVCLSEFAKPKAGLATGDNEMFERYWFEVNRERIGFGYTSTSETINGLHKWFPCNSGGEFRKWSFNNEIVVDWYRDGEAIKSLRNASGRLAARPQNTKYYFKRGLTWNKLSSSRFAVKYKESGFIYDDTSRSIFLDEENNLLYLLGLLCSTVTFNYLKAFNPTMSFTNGDIERVPFILSPIWKKQVDGTVQSNISISKRDWDAFEISWDFEQHPIVRKALSRFHWNDDGPTTIEYVYRYVAQDFEDRFQRLKANEEELNRIFIDIYGLQSELTPEVEEENVTVRHADLGRDIRSLISYAVGCMFGRYSLGRDGLAYAGGEWDENKYPLFPADKDNVIPVCDDEYFEDDILGRFVEFVRVVFGDETLDENLKYIADALGGKGQPKDVIRSYFMNDFYADHLKIYQKRPIYWLFDSGKKGGFKCLIYMHRYQPDTIARIRTDYVHEQQSRYRTAIADLEKRMESAATGERVKVSKQLKKLQEQAEEIRVYEEKIHHLADQMIKIDLDDGVRVNYAKFQDVLAKIK